MTIACLDVDYRPDLVVTACVGFERWTDAAPAFEVAHRSTTPPAEYQPGRFFLRELPYLLEALEQLPERPELIVVDGYAWLGPHRPGLGGHLWLALKQRTPVVGVAKHAFRSAAGLAVSIRRGRSRTPLHVTAAGVEPGWAAERVRGMHGDYRLPTLLKRADRLSRDA